ncbi:hypothetical protein CF68_33275 [Cupriavidus sp. SK-4]|uniref:hypothetical protein n=1 Tax=Cupriavidus sp. SK-4 TaxID=574750 RepID=UPI00044E69D8|nr:hypothetical protein [Cupriavidus sp. SK-4]EYS89548.1 hypothetical protein CF68_33275 [Cupriavidus sp. SK-4]
MTALEKQVIEAALRKMFAQGHFSICTVDSCLGLLNIPKGGKTYQLLHALHCVDFSDMDRELAHAVPSMIGELFQGISFDVPALMSRVQAAAAPVVAEVVEPAGEPRRGFLRLLGGR